MPEIDAKILGECQALIINFEKILKVEFGNKYSIFCQDYIPLQLHFQNRKIPVSGKTKSIIKFIETHRESIDNEIINTQDYSFKLFMIPELGNHRNSSDVSIEFINIDDKNQNEMKSYQKSMIGIKQKKVEAANVEKYRPSVVIKQIEKRTKMKSINWHTSMWKKYKVRPNSKNLNKYETKFEYCIYDEASTESADVYLYTNAWIEFLIKTEILK
jgi:hypothetical protein